MGKLLLGYFKLSLLSTYKYENILDTFLYDQELYVHDISNKQNLEKDKTMNLNEPIYQNIPKYKQRMI